MTNTRITQLDGWRGVSILFVIMGHLLNYRYSALGPADTTYPVARVLSAWGVNLFFVISGFIITKLALSERDTKGSFSVLAFYVRRFFRIVPAFFLYLASVLLLTAAGLISQRQTNTLRAMTFTCNIPKTDCGWFAGHSWTLAYEEQFYLIFPLLLALSGRSDRRVFVTLLVLLISFPFLRFLLDLGVMAHTVAQLLPSFIFICVGSVMAAYEPLLKRLSERPNAANITYLAGGITIALLWFISAPAEPSSQTTRLQAALGMTLLPICFAWLISDSLYRNTLLTRLLNARVLQFVGLISYSLYIWQQLFTAHPSSYLTDSWLLFPPVMFVVSAASHYLVERPCVHLGKRLLNRSAIR